MQNLSRRYRCPHLLFFFFFYFLHRHFTFTLKVLYDMIYQGFLRIVCLCEPPRDEKSKSLTSVTISILLLLLLCDVTQGMLTSSRLVTTPQAFLHLPCFLPLVNTTLVKKKNMWKVRQGIGFSRKLALKTQNTYFVLCFYVFSLALVLPSSCQGKVCSRCCNPTPRSI